MDVLLVDLALALVLLGGVSLVRPFRFLRIRTRRAALWVAAAGLALLVAGLSLPVVPPRLPGARMAIDEIVPDYRFGEHHEILVAAPPGKVLDAARAVTAREIRLFLLLTWLRSPRFSSGGQPSILHPGADRPLLEVALGSGFVMLRQDQREIVIGTVVCCGPHAPLRTAAEFAALEGSLARAVMSFHVEDEGSGVTRLVTQTRIATTDRAAERAFARYWRVIYPGSSLIRSMWLRAIKRRAEAGVAAAVRP